MYFEKYHFNFNKFVIIGKLVKCSVRFGKNQFFSSKVDKMSLLLHWVTYIQPPNKSRAVGYTKLYSFLNLLRFNQMGHPKNNQIHYNWYQYQLIFFLFYFLIYTFYSPFRIFLKILDRWIWGRNLTNFFHIQHIVKKTIFRILFRE